MWDEKPAQLMQVKCGTAYQLSNYLPPKLKNYSHSQNQTLVFQNLENHLKTWINFCNTANLNHVLISTKFFEIGRRLGYKHNK